MKKEYVYSYENVLPYETILELTKQGIEVWRRVIIDGKLFDYEVSNLGRIKSLIWNGNGKKISFGNVACDTGYMYKDLQYTDKLGKRRKKQCRIHDLVAIAFIPNPENKNHVTHINKDITDNKVTNLYWTLK